MRDEEGLLSLTPARGAERISLSNEASRSELLLWLNSECEETPIFKGFFRP